MIDDLKPSGQVFWILGACAFATALLGSVDEFGLPPAGVALAGALLTGVVAWLTPFTRQFGVGAHKTTPEDDAANQ